MIGFTGRTLIINTELKHCPEELFRDGIMNNFELGNQKILRIMKYVIITT